jgi:hypothetical protein
VLGGKAASGARAKTCAPEVSAVLEARGCCAACPGHTMPTAKVISKQAGSSQSRRFSASALMEHSLPDLTLAEKEIPLSVAIDSAKASPTWNLPG